MMRCLEGSLTPTPLLKERELVDCIEDCVIDEKELKMMWKIRYLDMCLLHRLLLLEKDERMRSDEK
jgi:hypothetical protein